MANKTVNNYTISTVVYEGIVAGSNVYNQFPTAVLTITANAGYAVNANDFAWINTSLNYVNTVLFVQSGLTVVCTVTFDSNFVMPGANTSLALCISGSATKSGSVCEGKYIVTGVSTNMSIVANSPVPNGTGSNYSMEGLIGDQEVLLVKTYTASSGYAFRGDFNIVFSGPEINPDNYSVVYAKTNDASGNLTSVTISVSYIFPSIDAFGDILTLAVPGTYQIAVAVTKITSYSIDSSTIGPSGEVRVLRVFGAPTTTFSLITSNGNIIDIGNVTGANETPVLYGTNTPSITLPASGYFDIRLIIPASSNINSYAFTLNGGNILSPFPQPNPILLAQRPDVVLTFAAAGTNLSVTNTTPSPAVKTFPANTEPVFNSPAYNNTIVYTVTGNSGQTLSLPSNPTAAWTNLPLIDTSVTSAITNASTVAVASATGITNGMRMTGVLVDATKTFIVTNVSGTNITFSGGNITLPQFAQITFDSRKGSELELPVVVSLNSSNTVATVTVNGTISKYGDENVTFQLNLATVITVGGVNQCLSWNMTAGARGGTAKYYLCDSKKEAILYINKGESNFSLCALASPAIVVSDTVTASATSTVCDDASDQSCFTYSVIYNPTALVKNPSKTISVKYQNCATNAGEVISVGISGTATTFCATRQDPVFSDATGSTTVTRGSTGCS